MLRDIYRVEDARYQKTLTRLTELLDLGEIVKTPARQLSLGQRMRCEIAASLLHSPKILFLDEPTIGLDAVSKGCRPGVHPGRQPGEKTTVLLTTHDMQDIEALTERILLIGRGRILLDGSLSELKARNAACRTVTVDYLGEKLRPSEHMAVKRDVGGHAEIVVDTAFLTISEAISRISAQVEVKDLSVRGMSAEELAVSLYREFEI